MKRIMLIMLILILFISCSSVYAENNISDDIMADNNLDDAYSKIGELESSELNNLEKSSEVNDVDELNNMESNESTLEAGEGEYVDASEAYDYLNTFRTEKNVWYWNGDDTTQSHVNTNDTVWLKPLERDIGLENTAKIRAKEISEYFSHYRPDGSICFTIFPENLLDYGENIAYGYETCFEVTEGWKETNESYSGQGHRRNMLQADYNYVGIAGYKVNGTTYWVQNFGCRYDPKDIGSDTSFYFSNSTANPKFSIEVPLYASGSFSVSVNGIPIDTKSITNGRSTIAVCGLSPGAYDVYLSYSGDYNCKPVNKTETIIISDNENPNVTLTFNDLNTLVLMANGEIKLEKDYAYDSDIDSSFVQGISISKPLTIDGQGHVIDGSNLAKIFNILSYDVILKNIILINANANSYVPNQNRYFDSSSYGVTSYYYANTKPNRNGGAIYSQVPFSVFNSTFLNNVAYNGSAIYSFNRISIENSSFVNNSANDDGGAIYSHDYISIIDTNLTDNYALDLGGAVYSLSTLEATNSIFKNNTNLGIFVKEFISNNNMCIDDEYLNLFFNATVKNGVVTLNKDYNASGTVLINASNVIIDGNGYTIDAQNRSRIFYITGDNVTVRNIKFVNGNSINEGGAIYASSSSLTIMNSTFSNSIAQSGGVIYGSSTDIVIEDSSFNNNNVKDFSGNEICEGGVVCTRTGSVSISNSSFINNTAYYGGVIHTDTGFITLQDSYFENNDALIYAGGVVHSEADVNIINSTFLDNYAPGYGGAIFCYGESNLHVMDSTFRNNTSNHYGGAISAAVNVEIINSSFTDNSASDHGGVISLWGNLSVMDSNFTNNSAGVAGAIFDYSETADVLIENSNFVNNSQGTYGAVYLTNNAIVKDSNFINNHARDGVGGGIVSFQNLTVLNSTFVNNSAVRSWGDSVGGAIINYGEDLYVEDSIFTNNSVNRGGAIANFAGNAYIDGSTFTNNSADKEGGGIYNHVDTFCSVSNSIFENNSAEDGGAIYRCNAVNTTFIQNHADVASAMYGDSNTADNCTFIKNVDFVQGPTVGVVESDCSFEDNRLIVKAVFIPSFLQSSYYSGDKLEMTIYSYTDYSYISNATVTIRAYKSNDLAGEFEYLSGDGWIVNLTEGNYKFEFSVENQDYYVTPINANITILKKEIADVFISIDNNTYSDPTIVNLVSNLDGSVGVYVDDFYMTYLNVVANETAQIRYDYISAGNHTLKVVMTPSNYHFDSKTFVKDFTVFKKPTFIELEVENITDDQSVVVNVKASDGGFVIVTVGDYSLSDYVYANEESQFDFGFFEGGIYEVSAIFSVDENHINSNSSKTLKIFSKVSSFLINISMSEDNSTDFAISLPDDATGKVVLDIAGKKYDANVVNGTASVKVPELPDGLYDYTVTYSGDSKYSSVSKSGKFVTKKESVGTVIVMESTFSRYATDYYAGERGELFYGTLYDVNGNPLADKTVQITVNGVIYDVVTDKDGKAGLAVNLAAANTYTYALLFSGDEDYKASLIASSKLTVVKKPTSIIANSMAFKTNAKTKTVTVALNTIKNPYDGNLYLKKGKKLTLTVNGKTYSANTDQDGISKFNINIAKKGKYTATIKFDGDKTYEETSKKITITISNSPAKNKDLTGVGVGMEPSNIDVGGTLNIVGDYYDYLAKENVSASENNQNKKDAEIVVDQKFTRVATDYYACERGDYFYATLKDSDGKPLVGKTVQIAVNGPIYKVITDKNGKAGLQVNLAAANTYTYALSFSGDESYNPAKLASSKLTVIKKTTSISASNAAFKKSAKTKTISVTLKTSKNPYDTKTYLKSGKQLTLKVNGKTYTATTNSHGVAKFSIKLTKKGKFTSSIAFSGDKTYDSCSKSIKITIK